jgi:hypothetical protein
MLRMLRMVCFMYGVVCMVNGVYDVFCVWRGVYSVWCVWCVLCMYGVVCIITMYHNHTAVCYLQLPSSVQWVPTGGPLPSFQLAHWDIRCANQIIRDGVFAPHLVRAVHSECSAL